MRTSKKYKFDNKKYYEDESNKHQIVIGNSFSSDMSYTKGWDNRIGGEYKSTAPYTIDLDGTIYEHYDSKYYSDFIYSDNDKFIIPIKLVNEGWLNSTDKKEHFNCFNNIYNREEELVEQEWRGKNLWASYSKKQINSLVRLCTHLCEKHGIPLKAMTHNTKSNTVKGFNGIAFRSNYNEMFRDITPAFDFKYFLKKINDYENK